MRPNTAIFPHKNATRGGHSPHLAEGDTLSRQHLRKSEFGDAKTSAAYAQVVVKLKKNADLWHAVCDDNTSMTRIQAICPISMRPAYFGSRRIAPVAEPSRSQGWGARPSVEEPRPAHHSSDSKSEISNNPHQPFVATFVTQVMSQLDSRAPASASHASRSYESADALNACKWQWLSASV